MKKILIISLLLFFLLSAFIPYPEENPACGSPWIHIWSFENSIHCDGGEYHLFFCWPEDISKPSIFQAYCTSSTIVYKLYQTYIPLTEK